jgi:hypothetical protein
VTADRSVIDIRADRSVTRRPASARELEPHNRKIATYVARAAPIDAPA